MRKIKSRLQSFSGMLSCLLSLDSKKTKLLAEVISGKNIVIVASGPSINVTELSKIKDSVVFLVNYSARLKNKFDSSNFLVWFSADNERILECQEMSSSISLRVLTVYKYRGAFLVTRTMRKDDILLFPRVNWISLLKKLSPKPCLVYSARNHKIKAGGLGAMFTDLYPRTGVLTLISVCLNFGAKSIEVLGFDASHKSVSYASGLSPPVKVSGFKTSTIDEVLSTFYDMARRQGVVLNNCSPLTELKSIPVSYKYHKNN